jgi:hypothetical protein
MATFRILVVILRVKCVLYPAGTGLLVLYTVPYRSNSWGGKWLLASCCFSELVMGFSSCRLDPSVRPVSPVSPNP